jgi:hypothetical protein
MVSVEFELRLRPDEVIAHFKLREGAPWRALRDALDLGAVRREFSGEENFIAPYLSGTEADVEPNEFVITASNVNVRVAPDRAAQVIERLSYDVVSFSPDDRSNLDLFTESDAPTGPAAWVHIVTPSGTVGYVYGRYVRSPIDVRFRFSRVNGAWKIVSIPAGD